MSNNFIFISGLWFSEGFEMDDPISFYTQKILFLIFLITVTKCLTEVAGGQRGNLLWIMASALACAVEIPHILEDQNAESLC